MGCLFGGEEKIGGGIGHEGGDGKVWTAELGGECPGGRWVGTYRFDKNSVYMIWALSARLCFMASAMYERSDVTWSGDVQHGIFFSFLLICRRY